MKLKKVLRYIKHKRLRRNVSKGPVLWENAPDIKIRIKKLLVLTSLPFNVENITALRSYNSRAHAYARIWGLSKVWQMTLNKDPHYIIEILSEKYDSLTDTKKDEVLLHELAHIPANFSGSLVPHIRRGKRNFKSKVDKLIREVRFSSKLKT